MLDMSKAFDTIQRGSLLTDLEQVLDNDELHLISLLIDNVSYTVKLEGKLGLPFNTNIGSPQGDSASALFFITYLANSLKSDDNDIDAVILPSQLVDHDYSTTTTNSFFTVDQQYADDISWASTGQHILQDIEKRVSDKLAKPSEPANNNVAWGFPGCDAVSDDSLRIKFGDFEVQSMDNDKVIVYLDDLVFVDGVLVEGSSGLPSVPSNNNNHSIPLPSTTTTWRTNQPTRKTTARESAKNCVQQSLSATKPSPTSDKKLLKFEKAQRGIFKKRSVSHHRERDDVIRVLNRLSEESRQVVKIHHDMACQLKIKQRDQTILKKAVTSFGKEVKILEEKLRSQRQFFCEQEETLRKQWGEMLLIKERDCE
ncbi:hypothetical protein BSL78_29885, partial [Apostichopus japonicus]